MYIMAAGLETWVFGKGLHWEKNYAENFFFFSAIQHREGGIWGFTDREGRNISGASIMWHLS
jgi:hypothetical protein